MRNFIYSFLVSILTISYSFSQNLDERINTFEISSTKHVAPIIYDTNGSSLDSIAAHLLAKDIFKISGKTPGIYNDVKDIDASAIVIGMLSSPFIKELIKSSDIPVHFLEQKESYLYKTIPHPLYPPKKILIIAGTDPRGTAYAVLDLSKKLGVSPWNWWADVPVAKKSSIVLNQDDFFSKEPSVEFRGIFINDEDWGLQPWAAKTFEPEIGDIGPKTYSKIFELLLRLKANTIWPAMHPSTKAFFHYPSNPKTAQKYHIIVGSSHAEPMLRNNVDEWDRKTMGSFDYLSNKDTVYTYWEQRVKNTVQLDAIYTLGMRGIHDSGMEGVNSQDEAANLLSEVIKDQRALLEKYRDDDIEEIPQAFTVYKEVLSLYDHGLELPEDITTVWTDDNYGYIRRLSDKTERSKAGGAGVYYHASYWGRPHDYLWLSTTSPGLIREEMMKAYDTQNRKIWILNVGDIKPAEYNLQLFMDMAWDVSKFKESSYLDEHLQEFYTSTFGNKFGKKIANLKKEYYQLAFERKPEYMGWSQTEPTTETKKTGYSPFKWGDEIKSRIDNYERLAKTTASIEKELPTIYKDAYFQLVDYPIKGAALMNKKWLYHDKAVKYGEQNRLSAKKYHQLSIQSHDGIKNLTDKYNTQISNGKWNHIMDMKPRNLPVYQQPELPKTTINDFDSNFGISVENASKEAPLELPEFNINFSDKHFIDLFLKKTTSIKWEIKQHPGWLIISKQKGLLNEKHLEERLYIEIDSEKWLDQKSPEQASFQLKTDQKTYTFRINIRNFSSVKNKGNIYLVKNGIASLFAEDFQNIEDKNPMHWKVVEGLGYSGKVMQAGPLELFPLDTNALKENAPVLAYKINSEKSDSPAQLELHILPTHPITQKHQVRLGVQWDDSPIQIIDFKTEGRSEEWKLNVLRNSAVRTVQLLPLEKGTHTLKIYMIDQGVCLDYMYLKTDENKEFPYSLLPKTSIN